MEFDGEKFEKCQININFDSDFHSKIYSDVFFFQFRWFFL